MAGINRTNRGGGDSWATSELNPNNPFSLNNQLKAIRDRSKASEATPSEPTRTPEQRATDLELRQADEKDRAQVGTMMNDINNLTFGGSTKKEESQADPMVQGLSNSFGTAPPQ